MLFRELAVQLSRPLAKQEAGKKKMKRIFVVGGGYAGVKTALTLHKKLRRNPDVEITLVDRSEHHTLLTELHEVAGNRVDDTSVLVPLRKIFQYTKVKLIKDDISHVELSENRLFSSTAEYEYDYLVLAGGSRPTFFGVPGVEEHAFTLWSHADAVRIRDHIRKQFLMASQTTDLQCRRQMLTLAVCGGGFTGVELIGELARWQKELCREYGIASGEVNLILVEATDKILTVLPDKLVLKSMHYLQRLGVEVMLNSPIVEVGATAITLKSGQLIPTNTLIWAAGVEAGELSGKTGLELEKRERVQVNEYQQTEVENVYCIGDMASGLPALVEAALQTAETAALNIVADIEGTEKRPIDPRFHGVMVSIGRWWGVADLMGVHLTGILAIIMKHLVNLHYLFDIGGFELCIKYIKHEFFRESLSRPLLEAQFVHQRPLFWLVPIRLYLGYMWFMQGLQKLQAGWWNEVILKAGETAVEAVTAVTGATDAVTAATGASGSGMSLISAHTPGWYAWIVERFIYPNALFFQRSIVATEFILGVLFLIGAFTFVAAVVSIALNINFVLTTGVYDYWYVMASLAMMAGAGMVFGADSLIMPYLMRQWRYLVRNGRVKAWL